jgi:FdhD protein
MTTSLPPTLLPGHPLLGLGYADVEQVRPYVSLDGDSAADGSTAVAEEVPVAFVYNHRPHVVMMATPADFEDFAVGFTLTEEIVSAASAIEDCQVVRYSQGVELQLTIHAQAAEALADRGRQLLGRTGCGLCGVQTVAEALRPIRSVNGLWGVEPAALWRAEASLSDRQVLNRVTASVHAAAWATIDGELRVVREDVGRHNALDKVVGALARENLDPATGFLVLTSRASYELVQKATAVGIPMLAAVSRPTGLAIRLAEASGLTLVALLRGSSANVYSHAERLHLN